MRSGESDGHHHAPYSDEDAPPVLGVALPHVGTVDFCRRKFSETPTVGSERPCDEEKLVRFMLWIDKVKPDRVVVVVQSDVDQSEMEENWYEWKRLQYSWLKEQYGSGD